MKNFNNIIRSFLIVLSIGFVACTERMDIDVNDAPVQLAIYGSITTDTTQHVITVQQTSNYFSNSQPVGISGATVSISDDEGNTFTLSESQNGEYLTDADVFGVEGKTYTLKVRAEFNGEAGEYEATSYLPYHVQVDSVKLQPSKTASTANIIDALLYGRLPENSSNNYLNIKTYKNNNIPLDAKLADFNIITSENGTNKEINGDVCANFRDGGTRTNSIDKGDLITIQVCSVTKEYADYVLNAQKELQGSIPIFSGPPANVQTNIRAKNASEKASVCGFFTAYSKRSCKVLFE
ncbi:MAG: hypothetical protein EZS26_002145 [Candidatus Ordinivivax streblomastigis]|uniref:DUF4249 domain-containing protein n=1 Tax=Candidatus Ordinivivax streblomastigis TaxID=2540710 RepID=A0A5M8NZY4_9BACT|nr:MAG: hypothetical protein EZS26_002145 [Candidatus Ordinivivax streblomastigis]